MDYQPFSEVGDEWEQSCWDGNRRDWERQQYERAEAGSAEIDE